MIKLSIEIKRSDKYAEFNVSAPSNRGYITIDTSSWIDKPWMFYELPALKFEIYTESDGEVIKYKNFVREIRTYNPVYSPLGVLNVTIDIRNVPEEFTLRVIPIFDNDSISARNMLIENGIEDGEVWGKDQDIPTQSFDLDIEFIECTGEYIPPIPPTHEETVTFTEPPYTFDDSDGSPIISLTIKGNGQQSGTPSPQNIVPFDGTGERTGNLYDINAHDTNNGYADNVQLNSDGTTAIWGSVEISEYIPIDGDTSYTFNGIGSYNSPAYCLYDVDKQLIGGYAYSGRSIISFTSPSNARYFRFTHIKSSTKAMLVKGTYTASTMPAFVPYGFYIPLTAASVTTPLYLGEVSTVRRVGKIVLTGAEDWGTDTNVGIRRFYAFFSVLNNVTVRRGWCTHFKYQGLNEYYSCYKASDSTRVYIFTDHVNTVKDFKAWLASEYAAGHPVTIWYILASEQTGIVNEPLMKIGDYADELTTTTPIPTAKGSNTLTVDTTVQPSEVSITYTAEG